MREEFSHPEACPGVIKDSQPSVIKSLLKLNLLSRKEALALEGSNDQLASIGRQVGDVRDGSRAWALGSAEGLAHQVGDVGLAVLARGFSSLDEHGLQTKPQLVY